MTYPGCRSVQSLVILPSALQGGSLPILPSVCPCCRLIRSSFCINVFPSSCLFSSLFCPFDYPSASACSFTTPPVLFDCSFTRTLVRLFFLPSVTMLYHSVRSSISLSFSLCQFTRPFSFHSVFHTSVRFFASLHLSVLLYTLFSFIFVIYFVNIFFLLFIILSLHPTAHLSTCSSFCLFVHIVVRIFLLVYVLLVWLPVCYFVRFCPSVFLPVQLFILFYLPPWSLYRPSTCCCLPVHLIYRDYVRSFFRTFFRLSVTFALSVLNSNMLFMFLNMECLPSGTGSIFMLTEVGPLPIRLTQIIR